MGRLKGQNFRILVYDSTVSKYKCIGMSTNCVITMNNNTEQSETKDDIGMAAKPTMTSQSWQVQVDSLNVADAGAMLTAIKSMTPFTLLWDETSTTDNQTALNRQSARTGQAYLSDATFTFNDRENSSKSLTFIGASEINEPASTVTTEVLPAGSYTKGQFVRLFLSSDNTNTPTEVIAAAKQLQLHVSLQMEDATTKDTEGSFQVQEPVGLSYDISTTALLGGNDTITSSVMSQLFQDIEDIYKDGSPVKWQIANVSGANNRTKGAVICSGSALIQTLTMNAPNKQSATYTAQLQGYGVYTVGS